MEETKKADLNCYCPAPLPQQSVDSGDFSGKCGLCGGIILKMPEIKEKKGKKK